jgi:Uncharacterized membrane protein
MAADDPKSAKRYLRNLRDEIDSAALYRTFAELEDDPQLADIYGRLAAVEEAHAQFWRDKLERAGLKSVPVRPGARTRVLAWLARRLGTAFILPTVNLQEQADVGKYDRQPDALAGGLAGAERSHAHIIQAVVERQVGGRGMSGSALARLEGRHRMMGGNALRAAVLGANDGLVSNFSLVMGMAGAAADGRVVLMTGLAGLVAGACSMAMGEWLSVNSSRELYRRQIATEAEELENSPEEEREELVLIYEAKGLEREEARRLAARMIADKGNALDTLSREELGIDPDDLGGSAWTAALSSCCLFALGAVFPILPYTVLDGTAALWGSVAASGLALFAIGGGTSLFTGRGMLFSGFRQLAVGLCAAAVTYGIGGLLGASVAG